MKHWSLVLTCEYWFSVFPYGFTRSPSKRMSVRIFKRTLTENVLQVSVVFRLFTCNWDILRLFFFVCEQFPWKLQTSELPSFLSTECTIMNRARQNNLPWTLRKHLGQSLLTTNLLLYQQLRYIRFNSIEYFFIFGDLVEDVEPLQLSLRSTFNDIFLFLANLHRICWQNQIT